MSKQRRLTASRLGRLSQLGRLAGGLAGGALAEGARKLASGDRPTISDVLLTPGNAQRLGERLSEMRGAAMKVGQLLSMDSGQILPAQISELLAGLREDAHAMPLGQVATVLEAAWGPGWEKQFTRFSFTPLAAASIGQVHEAMLKDGRRLAIKIQYPGVRESIDSDVDNVAGLLRFSRLLPEGMEIEPLLTEAKAQLHNEADYKHESVALKRFASKLAGDTRFDVPQVIDALTDEQVLSMQFLDGQPIESLADATSAERNTAAAALAELALREVFEWGIVQTDPNFANYLYSPHNRRIQLLDFGATRDYEPPVRHCLRNLLLACIDGSDGDLAAHATAAGYMAATDPAGYQDSIVRLLRTATEPARTSGDYNFAQSGLATRMRDQVLEMRGRDGYARMPPPALLFLHRKLGGLYLLLRRLRASLPVSTIIAPVLAHAGDGKTAQIARTAC